MAMINKKVEVYTDGACSGNPGPGGWGATIRTVSYTHLPLPTNREV